MPRAYSSRVSAKPLIAACPSSRHPGELLEKRDVVEPLALVFADAALHVGARDADEVAQVESPRELPDDELRRLAAARVEGEERDLVRSDDPADRFARVERNAGAPEHRAHVDRAAARVAGLAHLAAGRVDHGGLGLADVVQQRREEQDFAARRVGMLEPRRVEQRVEHHARVDADVALGVIPRALRRGFERLEPREDGAAVRPVPARAPGCRAQGANVVVVHRCAALSPPPSCGQSTAGTGA